jgi:hypothetical protein
MKSVYEWFLWADAQGYEWVHKAHKNLLLHFEHLKDINCGSLHSAITIGLNQWSATPEGYNYWLEIYHYLTLNNI